MPLLIAPYNNAMRLGQGFNSYTQQICIDDAVVVDPNRAENVVTNDGTTMRIMSQSALKPSAWNRQREIVNDTRAEKAIALISEKALSPAPIGSLKGSETINTSQGDNQENIAVSNPSPSDSKSEKESLDGDKTIAESTTEMQRDSERDAVEDEPSKKGSKVNKSSQSETTVHEALGGGAPESSVIRSEKSEDATSDLRASIRDVESNVAASNRPLVAIERADAAPAVVEADTLLASATPEEQGSSLNTMDQPAQNTSGADEEPILEPAAEIPGQTRPGSLDKTVDSAQSALVIADPKPDVQGTSNDKTETSGNEKPAGSSSSALEDELVLAELRLLEKEEKERIAAEREYRLELEREAREEERERRKEEREEAKEIRQEKRQSEKQRREDNRKAIKDAVASNAQGVSLEDLKQIAARNHFADRFSDMAADDEAKYTFDPTTARGPSQTVVYTSKFVERLSDVTDDMCLSGALSIKAAKIGGSGRGSFVDSDKFKQSDLNFYISVKVTNQTVNFKDALVFNPLRSVNEENFNKVYGDSFISGFMEGGEFNAVVSMKVLNKAKMTDIQAEAKVALTAGPVDITAEANVGIARSNLETNTETTIQVSWCGGGHIKPLEQQWNIRSLMQAAARFPDLVADCPQRTYAILTKYETLRSFLMRKPPSFTPLQYENAQMYTNALMDSFMTYKSMYKALGEDIFNIEKGLLVIESWDVADEGQPLPAQLSVSKAGQRVGSFVPDRSRFPDTLEGLSDARVAIRKQMTRIVNEVDAITNDPPLASLDSHDEPFQSPVSFKRRLPRTKLPEYLQRLTDPLSGKRIMAPTQTEAELAAEVKKQKTIAREPLVPPNSNLLDEEKKTIEAVLEENPSFGNAFKVSSAIGSVAKGDFFSNLEFLRPRWQVQSVGIGVSDGAVTYVEVDYENGVRLQKGQWLGRSSLKRLASFEPGERIISSSIECGVGIGETQPQVLSLRLFTNRGRRLLGEASVTSYTTTGTARTAHKDGKDYEKIQTINLDTNLANGTFKGFFGRVSKVDSRVYRLGIIWGLSDGDAGRPTTDAAGTGLQALDENMHHSQEERLSQLEADLAEKKLSLDQSQEKVSALEIDLARANKDLDNTQAALKDSKVELGKSQSLLNQFKDGGRPVTDAQSGIYQSRWKMEANDTKAAEVEFVEFSPEYEYPPVMISGIIRLDLKCRLPISFSTGHRNVSHKGFDAFMKTGYPAYSPELSWLTLPENKIRFQTGIFDTSELARTDHNQTVSSIITFPRKYANGATPTVISWFCELNIGMDYVRALRCEVIAPTDRNFNLRVSTSGDRGDKFLSACVGWLAFDQPTNSVDRAEVGQIEAFQSGPINQKPQMGGVQFKAPFSKPPKVFIALMSMQISDTNNMRATAYTTAIEKDGFRYEAGTWDDTRMDHARWVWVAVG